ncbi:hypothetical protein LIER_01871 [Lithospermum erythrorhizon]|uniref:Integrase catalytic domain-containing protein n=1 Tax=Lithospermum erythrorhizon TaxID=34254 RepID=A0AAV3NMK4_LITER
MNKQADALARLASSLTYPGAEIKVPRKEEVAEFIKSNIIYRYRVPRCIITNNGKSFYNKIIADLCTRFKFKKYHSSMYYP